jgi:quercetin dioxygenase-like cupin family protein
MSIDSKRMARLVAMEPSAARDVLGILVMPLVGNGETGNHFGVFYAVVPPSTGIPVHSHPDVELFFVLEGALQLFREPDGEPVAISAGHAGFIPADALHGFVNAGPGVARVLITCTRGLENFLSEAGRPVDTTATQGPPRPEEIERVLAIARKHGQVFATAS